MKDLKVSKGYVVVLKDEGMVLFFSRSQDVGAYIAWYETSTRKGKPPKPAYIFQLPENLI